METIYKMRKEKKYQELNFKYLYNLNMESPKPFCNICRGSGALQALTVPAQPPRRLPGPHVSPLGLSAPLGVSNATTGLVSRCPQPCPVWPRTLLSQAHPPAYIPAQFGGKCPMVAAGSTLVPGCQALP